ncbi:hypothetical protein NKH77_52730 [Streptomyces sp. M19]
MSITTDAPRTTEAARLRADLVERATALRPLLDSNADVTDRERMVPAENIDALFQADLLSLARPPATAVCRPTSVPCWRSAAPSGTPAAPPPG